MTPLSAPFLKREFSALAHLRDAPKEQAAIETWKEKAQQFAYLGEPEFHRTVLLCLDGAFFPTWDTFRELSQKSSNPERRTCCECVNMSGFVLISRRTKWGTEETVAAKCPHNAEAIEQLRRKEA